MSDPMPSRRRVLRASATVGSLGLLGSLAGCRDALPAGNDDPTRIDTVPEGATYAFHVDVSGLLADEQVRSAADELLSSFETAPDSVSAALDRAESESGLDVRDVSETLAFGSTEGDASLGAVAWTDWSEADLTTAAEENGGDLEASTYGGVTVYRSGPSGNENGIAVLDDGVFATGGMDTVEDVVDVYRGDADPVGGDVRAAYEAARAGYVRFGFDLPSSTVPEDSGPAFDASVFRNVESGHGSLAVGDEAVLTVEFTAESADSAENVAAVIDGGLVTLEGQLEDNPPSSRTIGGQTVAERTMAVVEATEVSRDGATVTVANTSGVEAMVTVVGAVVGSFVLGLGGPRRSPAPQAAFSYEYDAAAGTVTVTHDGGDNIPRSELYVRGTGFRSASGADMVGPGPWRGTASADDGAAVAAGDSVTVGVASNYEVRLVWRPPDGTQSAVLAVDRGPDA